MCVALQVAIQMQFVRFVMGIETATVNLVSKVMAGMSALKVGLKTVRIP